LFLNRIFLSATKTARSFAEIAVSTWGVFDLHIRVETLPPLTEGF